MIKIYQISINREICNYVNANGRMEAIEKYPEYGAHLDLSFRGSKEYTPDMFKYFTEVYRVDTDSLDKAFELTNLWNDANAVEQVTCGHSTSVGDIMEKDGKFYMVDSFGFGEVGV